MEDKLGRLKDLIEKREAIDAELATLIVGYERKKQKCSVCQQEGHTARTCPQKQVQ